MHNASSSSFLNSFNHFRALAIVLVVAGHTTALAEISYNTFSENFLGSLVNGGTDLFVFISGVLFYHVYYHRFVYKDFIYRKTQTVILPYLFLGVPILVAIVLFQQELLADSLAPGPGETGLGAKLAAFALSILTGKFLNGYWFIPFIFATFLMSPLHIRFVTLRLRTQLWLIAALVVVSMLMHRPVGNLLIPQSLLYFLPVYLLGILCSMHKEQVYRYLQGREYWLVAGVLLLAACQAGTGHGENYHKAPLVWAGLDLMIVQKLTLCMLAMVWLHRFEQSRSASISTLATTSFAIYFLHPIVLLFAYKFAAELGVSQQESWLAFPILVAAIVAICLAIALTTKRLFPKISRYLIGY